MEQINMRFPGGRPKALTLSYDDCVEQDIRLIAIMQKYGLKGTFNLNSGCYVPEGHVWPEGTNHRRMSRSQAIRAYSVPGVEVAVHGLTHPFLERLPSALCTQEVLQDRLNLEADFGTLVRGMAYPYGTYNDDVVTALKCCGIVYSRTTVSTERFDIPTDWLRMPATCHHKNPRLMELAEAFLAPDRRPKLFYLWGHTFEFDHDDNWHVIEHFAQYLSGRDEIWHATNIEIYDYVQAYRQLIFSADGTRVYNPTVTELFFEADRREFRIGPGETLCIRA